MTTPHGIAVHTQMVTMGYRGYQKILVSISHLIRSVQATRIFIKRVDMEDVLAIR